MPPLTTIGKSIRKAEKAMQPLKRPDRLGGFLDGKQLCRSGSIVHFALLAMRRPEAAPRNLLNGTFSFDFPAEEMRKQTRKS